jgi:predicted ATPase
MQAEQPFRFNSFRLDTVNACLWRGRQMISLTPKAFAVLRYLVEHAGQLVTKDALLAAIWPEVYVSEGVLTGCIRELRKALGDHPQAPRSIQTVHRRGYRFIAKLQSSAFKVPGAESRPAPRPRHPTPSFVGREAELEQLQKWLKKALGGTRQLVFVTGEVGIGKTTLVEAFVAGLRTKNKVWISHGQCIEHYGAGEAYLPVLEALGRLCRGPGGERFIELLSQQAPTWLVQMPTLLNATDLEALQRRTQGTTRERMLRELAEALEVLTREQPLVLWLEDLHWSDVSTLDWLVCVARRHEPARLLVICTYRPVEVIVNERPLKAIKQELQVHGDCEELPLAFLTEATVAKYLAVRFAALSPLRGEGWGEGSSRASLQRLARLIHQRTDGNPLFMVNVVNYLISKKVTIPSDGQWTLQGEVAAVAAEVPESLQQMIEQQMEGLRPEDQRVLEVASVAGAEFSAAVVAAGLVPIRITLQL